MKKLATKMFFQSKTLKETVKAIEKKFGRQDLFFWEIFTDWWKGLKVDSQNDNLMEEHTNE